MKTEIGFTITRTNHRGLMEWITPQGWRSENAIFENKLEKSYFSREEGSKKIISLRSDCRIKSLAKSIILNYS